MRRFSSCRAVLSLCVIAGCGWWGSPAAEPESSVAHLNFVLDGIEQEQLYLRRLANIQLAVEKELAIVRLIRECGGLEAVCTGQGLMLKTRAQTQAPSSLELTDDFSPVPAWLHGDAGSAAAETGASPAVEPDLPTVAEPAAPVVAEPPIPLQVYQGQAMLEYAGRQHIVRNGDWVGPFQVVAIELDYLDFKSTDDLLRVPLGSLKRSDELAR